MSLLIVKHLTLTMESNVEAEKLVDTIENEIRKETSNFHFNYDVEDGSVYIPQLTAQVDTREDGQRLTGNIEDTIKKVTSDYDFRSHIED